MNFVNGRLSRVRSRVSSFPRTRLAHQNEKPPRLGARFLSSVGPVCGSRIRSGSDCSNENGWFPGCDSNHNGFGDLQQNQRPSRESDFGQ